MERSLSANITYLYLIKLSKWLMLVMPIAALFYNENGLDHFSIFILQAIYSLSVAVMEIPSGYFADVIGRRTTLIIGSILGTAGFVLYGISHDLMGFAIAEIILGIAGSFISGADSAILYDSLVADDRRQYYLTFEGRITAAGNFAETGAALCGGVLAALTGYREVYLVQALIAAMAVPASLLLVEPPRSITKQRPGFSHILNIFKTTLLENQKLTSTILLSSLAGISTLCMAWTAQVYFVHHQLSEIQITPLWIILNLIVGIVAAMTIKVTQLLGHRLSLLAIVTGFPLTYILMGLLPFGPALFCLLLFYGIRGYATPLLKDLVNIQCDAEVRATVLSIRSLIIRIGFAILGPSIGGLSSLFSLEFSLVTSGLLLGFLFLGTTLLLKKHQPALFRSKPD